MSRFWMGALVLVPAAYVAAWMTAAPWIVFVAAAAAIVPLAQWIRHATEHLAARAGSAIGGLLNVTFGNIAELMLALFVLAAGHATVVKARGEQHECRDETRGDEEEFGECASYPFARLARQAGMSAG